MRVRNVVTHADETPPISTGTNVTKAKGPLLTHTRSCCSCVVKLDPSYFTIHKQTQLLLLMNKGGQMFTDLPGQD